MKSTNILIGKSIIDIPNRNPLTICRGYIKTVTTNKAKAEAENAPAVELPLTFNAKKIIRKNEIYNT